MPACARSRWGRQATTPLLPFGYTYALLVSASSGSRPCGFACLCTGSAALRSAACGIHPCRPCRATGAAPLVSRYQALQRCCCHPCTGADGSVPRCSAAWHELRPNPTQQRRRRQLGRVPHYGARWVAPHQLLCGRHASCPAPHVPFVLHGAWRGSAGREWEAFLTGTLDQPLRPPRPPIPSRTGQTTWRSGAVRARPRAGTAGGGVRHSDGDACLRQHTDKSRRCWGEEVPANGQARGGAPAGAARAGAGRVRGAPCVQGGARG